MKYAYSFLVFVGLCFIIIFTHRKKLEVLGINVYDSSLYPHFHFSVAIKLRENYWHGIWLFHIFAFTLLFSSHSGFQKITNLNGKSLLGPIMAISRTANCLILCNICCKNLGRLGHCIVWKSWSGRCSRTVLPFKPMKDDTFWWEPLTVPLFRRWPATTWGKRSGVVLVVLCKILRALYFQLSLPD